MSKNASYSDATSRNEQDCMIDAYRHDAHKLTGEPHRTAPETVHGVQVNQPVSNGADGDAAAMSRPSGEPEQTMANHVTHYRLSLLTGESAYDSDTFARPVLADAIGDLLAGSDPEAMHRAWLTSNVARGFNESVHYPYTSLKYHTLLVAALLDAYRRGHEFEELLLIVDEPDAIVPHRTIYTGERFTLRIDPEADGQPWARLGSRPWQSWVSTWTRLTAHPLETGHEKYDMVLDANLRRIWSWSTALQYLEDFEQWGERP